MTTWRHGAKPVVGLIGAIGAGKTTLAAAFGARGADVINADALGHEALERPDVRQKLIARWGERIVRPDGRLDRRVIGGIVFAESAERTALEQLVFPYIRERALEEIAKAQADPAARLVVLDAAVLLEAGWNTACDRIVYVDAPRDERLARLAARGGWTAADLTAREAAQWPAAEKRRHADAVVVNDGDPARLVAAVDGLLAEWQVSPG